MALITELKEFYVEKNACLERLLAILEKEGEILKAGDVAPLWPLAEEKKDAAGKVLALRERIVQAMGQAGRSLDINGRNFRSEILVTRLSHAERAALEASFIREKNLQQQIRSVADANLKYLNLCLEVVGEMMSVFMRPAKTLGYNRSSRMGGSGNTYVNRKA